MPEPVVASRMKTPDPSCLFTCSHFTEAEMDNTDSYGKAMETLLSVHHSASSTSHEKPGSPPACFHEGHQAQGSSRSSGSLAGCQLQRGAQWSADFST